MHFSIPDTRELSVSSGRAPFVAYNIHVNGVFHCTVRYKQLHNLNEQLKKEYGASILPTFPSKKLLPLTPTQVESRRLQLEKYIQLLSQDPKIVNGEVFNGFLLSAQQETQDQKSEEVQLDIYLMNGHKITITILSTLQTDDVLQAVSKSIGLPEEHTYYFALFLLKKENDGQITIVRKMQDFESPYISLMATNDGYRVVLRRSYWDSAYDEELLEHRAALNVLYVQIVSDIERGWILTSREIQRQLAALQAKGSKKEYLQLAATLKYYGYIQFKPCVCDYPSAGTKVFLAAGNYELNLRISLDNEERKEFGFKVTRMRRWRITTSTADQSITADDNPKKEESRLELAFEYLLGKDKLQWITIVSEQAILMSVCLQGMVEELMMKKNGISIRKPTEKLRKGSWSYMKRDGSSHQICVSRSTSCDAILESSSNGEHLSNTESSVSAKKLADKLSNVSMGTKSSVRSPTSKCLIENDAFECIGDDDL